jgi:cell wall integrity and stress response component
MKALHSVVLVALAGCAHVITAEEDASYYACYSTTGSMKETISKDIYMARGACRTECVKDPGYAVMAMTKGTDCYCGQKLPNDAFKVDDAKCKQPCGGFATETCKHSIVLLLHGADALYRW